MGGLNPPVPQQDSNWEIRVAIQLSLFLQILLIFIGPMRKRSSSPIPRFTVWSSYLVADWVADLTLGLLLNNMGFGTDTASSSAISGVSHTTAGGPSAGGGSSPIIFAFWTPFLLLHLGGPDTITAYSLEDNQLWLRHLIGLLFELFSAFVVFLSSLRGNPMIPATVLVFIAGVIKYGERTFSLYSGSVDGFRSRILDPPTPGPNYAKLMTELDAKVRFGLDVSIVIANGEATGAQRNMERFETQKLLADDKYCVEARAYEFYHVFRRLFVNLILTFKERRRSQTFFLHRPATNADEAFEVVEVELNFIYDMVYTKAPVAHTKAGWILRSICSGCLIAALVIFFNLDKARHRIEAVDVAITYALLAGGLALDAVAVIMLVFSNRARVFLEKEEEFSRRWRLRWVAPAVDAVKRRRGTRRWSGKTSQMNLVDYCLGKPERNSRRGWRLLTVADKVGLEEIVDDFFFIRRVPLVRDVTTKESSLLQFVFDGLKNAALELEGHDKEKDEKKDKEEEKDQKAKIMEVCNRRGNGVIDHLSKKIKAALKNDRDGNKLFDLIRGSVVESPFDESLLLWHIATDLCRCRRLEEDDEKKKTPATARWRGVGETLAEYMLYLLIKQPEMLSGTAGIGLLRYRDTCAEARRFLVSMEEWIDGHGDAVEALLKVNTSESPAAVKGDRSKSALFDGVILAKALRELGDEELMWEVVAGVWVEMLTYAAGKCRGSAHVRQLSRGGELITLVWFLMAHMGLGDMYQIQEDGDAKAKLVVKGQ